MQHMKDMKAVGCSNESESCQLSVCPGIRDCAEGWAAAVVGFPSYGWASPDSLLPPLAIAHHRTRAVARRAAGICTLLLPEQRGRSRALCCR